MAIQTARHFGAAEIVAVGRNEQKLDRLDADVKIALDDDADRKLREQFDQGIDVVLDFVWASQRFVFSGAADQRPGLADGRTTCALCSIGHYGGREEIPIRGDMLRSTGLELIGSGIGSVAVADLLAGAGELLEAAPTAGFDTDFTSVPLSRITDAWNGDPNIRYILLPGQ